MTGKKIIGTRGIRTLPWVLVVFAFMFSRADSALAQCQWTSGSGTITQTCGSVGIGTTSPANLLHVVGPANTSAIFEGGASAHSLIQFRNGTSSRGYFGFVNSGSTGLGFLNAAGGTTNMLLTDNGKLGIGTNTPLRLLHLRDTSPTPVFTGTRISTSIDNSDPAYELLHETVNKGFRWRLGSGSISNLALDYTSDGFGSYSEYLTVLSTGNLGIGTSSPEARLHLYNSVTNQDNPFITIGPSITNGMNVGLGGGSFGDKSYFLHARDVAGSAATFRILTNGSTRMFFAAAGNIGIGTTSPQFALDVNGTISGTNVIAKYQDVAEWVPANRAMPAGTVVTLDPEHSNLVVASSHSYDTRVAGVVSEKPGVILGEGGEGKVMVATTGRVRVRVDATNGPIRVGDLLVTSDKEGIAMRSQPLDLGGTPIHRPGTLIGKALEPLEKGVGEILVLLSLQ